MKNFLMHRAAVALLAAAGLLLGPGVPAIAAGAPALLLGGAGALIVVLRRRRRGTAGTPAWTFN